MIVTKKILLELGFVYDDDLRGWDSPEYNIGFMQEDIKTMTLKYLIDEIVGYRREMMLKDVEDRFKDLFNFETYNQKKR